ncbi:organelle RRM domain-containing protein 6, chloroplastic-like, partial [Prunus avium]|uniref:Organelle RRM domain-containing protein 6, chloroplastic-like n=1 Tax=Prunus avium TaxID=42229 RepID=A0A6P5RJC8_PRUAV
ASSSGALQIYGLWPIPVAGTSNRKHLSLRHKRRTVLPLASLSSSSPSYSPNTSTKLYVSGLSFRTTEESLRNAFQNFGQLVEVNLVMDRIANRPRGFAFLRYATEEESQKAIEGMHGKFLDGRVIFVEVAKPRSELRQTPKQNPRRY